MHKKIKKNKLLLELLVAFLTITGCATKTKIKQTKNIKTQIQVNNVEKNKSITKKTNKEEHTITVWVHGTRFMQSFLQKKIFKKYFFYRDPGLKKAASYDKQHGPRKIAETLHNQNTTRFDIDNFYFFGWSGKLSHTKRKEAAQELDDALKKLIAEYKEKYGVIPKIRLITHSHGGNVALCLSDINKNCEHTLIIDELILLACPVQEKTAYMIKDDIFKQVYSLYSTMDILQVIDPQGLKFKKDEIKTPFFSKRVFEPQENLTQTRLKINGRGILHIEFLLSNFMHALPHILEELDSWDKTESDKQKLKLLKINTKSQEVRFKRKFLKA